MTLTDIRAAALLTLWRHGARRPNDMADWADIPRPKIGAVLGWAAQRGYVKRDGRKYAILPDGRDWLRKQGVKGLPLLVAQ